MTLNGCKKETDPQPNDGLSVTVFKNPTNDPNADALQAIITNSDYNYSLNVYGTFDSNSDPNAVRSIVYQKNGNDTTVYMIMNDDQRLKTAYITVSLLVNKALLSKIKNDL